MHEPRAVADPVFVLCAARSGSTLLRFLLDAHPDLACPPETDLPSLCRQLTQTWSVLAGEPVRHSRGGAALVPEPLRAGVRGAVKELIWQHLARRGKKRLCEKSLFSAAHADLLTQLFPDAKFLCLYRHPMDMIASGIEACPWGLKGFGFDSYAAGSPGSEVLALARYWADHAEEIRAAEERYPERCYRVRYEDLVADPETVADGIFGFLEVPSVPGISGRCFSPDRERLGPGDYKIWQTSRVTAGSVGRGWPIPPDQIDPPVRDRINRLADELGYVRVDQTWGGADTPPDLRAGHAAPSESARAASQPPHAIPLLGDRLQAGLSRVDARFRRAWGACAREPFLIVAASPAGDGQVARWLVDPAERTITLADGATANKAVRWQLTGSAACWERVLAGTANLNVSLRRRELRYADTGTTPGTVTVTRIDMLSDLLGVTSWRPAEDTPPVAASVRAPAA